MQRARIDLARAAGERTRALVEQIQCDQATEWRAWYRYQTESNVGLLADGRKEQSGRRATISPFQRAQIVELSCLEPLAKGRILPTSPVNIC